MTDWLKLPYSRAENQEKSALVTSPLGSKGDLACGRAYAFSPRHTYNTWLIAKKTVSLSFVFYLIQYLTHWFKSRCGEVFGLFRKLGSWD